MGVGEDLGLWDSKELIGVEEDEIVLEGDEIVLGVESLLEKELFELGVIVFGRRIMSTVSQVSGSGVWGVVVFVSLEYGNSVSTK